MPSKKPKVYGSPYQEIPVSLATRKQLRQIYPASLFAAVLGVTEGQIEEWQSGRGRITNWQAGAVRWMVTHPENESKMPRMIEHARNDGKLDLFLSALGKRWRARYQTELANRKIDERHKR